MIFYYDFAGMLNCCFRAVTLSPLYLVVNWPVFTARRNARIASAVLAKAIPSVSLSVRLSVWRYFYTTF